MRKGRPMKCVLGPPISCCAAFCCVQQLATGGIQLRSLHQTASSSGSTQRSQNRNDLPSLPSNPYQEFGINSKTKNMNTWLQQRRCLPGGCLSRCAVWPLRPGATRTARWSWSWWPPCGNPGWPQRSTHPEGRWTAIVSGGRENACLDGVWS